MGREPWWSRARPRLLGSPPARNARREAIVAGALLTATACSVFLVYLVQWQPADAPRVQRLLRAGAFTATLLGILLAHEAGHFLMARRHGLRLGLPWFLPFPFLVGTLGAVIRMDQQPRSRVALAAMGAAGPMCGLAAVVAVMFARLAGSRPPPAGADQALAAPWLWTILGTALGSPSPPYITPGDPLAFAAWIGCLVTAMNLLPIGQLDGGHVLRAFLPRRARAVSGMTLGALLALGWGWPGWWAWLGALLAAGAHRAVDAPPGERPSPVWGIVSIAAFFACFTARPTGWRLW